LKFLNNIKKLIFKSIQNLIAQKYAQTQKEELWVLLMEELLFFSLDKIIMEALEFKDLLWLKVKKRLMETLQFSCKLIQSI
jgi:hypothetical protein